MCSVYRFSLGTGDIAAQAKHAIAAAATEYSKEFNQKMTVLVPVREKRMVKTVQSAINGHHQ